MRRLDQLKAVLPYAKITTEVMLKAAELWAEARRSGQPTSDPKALDGDVILAAQALLAGEGGDEVVVATTNVGHLVRFVSAKDWQEIIRHDIIQHHNNHYHYVVELMRRWVQATQLS